MIDLGIGHYIWIYNIVLSNYNNMMILNEKAVQ